jgi:hypothetical protein
LADKRDDYEEKRKWHRRAGDWSIDSLKELFDRLICEHDRRYEQRFISQEVAVAKAEAAQREYNIRSNEFRQALDDQNKNMLPRVEADQRFGSMRELVDKQGELINQLLRGSSHTVGGSEALSKARTQANWLIGLSVMVAVNMLGLIVALVMFFMGRA